ncbi:MAG: hypothetical protein PHZ00_00195 [Candidatus Peribacteraceae bacterium]|nr:hypothetical protein [Candidatus Peribacteraceae bacterium]
MLKTCANPHCHQSFEITPDEETFLKKMTFTFGKESINPPLPVFCPECRLRIRTCHRNERAFYKRKVANGKEMVSIYHEEPLWGESDIVFTPEDWNDHKRDGMGQGRAYDFSRPFFDQFANLHKASPRMGMMLLANDNCDFTAGTAYSKNCYLINSSEYDEDCLYGKLYQSCRSSVDCSLLYGSELCYDCFSVYDSYNCTSVSFSKNCRDCLFSTDLIGCSDCCLCSNLHKKQYHFGNKPLPKEEYLQKIEEFRGSHTKMEEMKQKLAELRKSMIHRAVHIVNSEDCTGDFIENSQRCTECYDVNESQDSRYVTVGVNVKDVYDCSNMYLKPELAFETLGTIETYNVAYCLYVFHSQNLLYCEYCFSCSDCFGCSGLRQKKYCILNKQHTKKEYEELMPKIIEHMQSAKEFGRFFPSTLSPFGYNETLAQEYLPLTETEAKERGFYWRTVTDKKPNVTKTIDASDLPDAIEQIPDDVLNWAVVCEATKRPFRIVKQELEFYRRQRLPIPHLHPDERYDRRLALRNPRKLWHRSCAICQKEISTTCAPERTEKVVCEECYLKEVY